MKSMLKDLDKISERYNALMASEEEFKKKSEELIKDISILSEKYPLEQFPLMMLSTLICKSRNQTKHIDVLHKMIELGNDGSKTTLLNCKKQPCNECDIWDDDKKILSLSSRSVKRNI